MTDGGQRFWPGMHFRPMIASRIAGALLLAGALAIGGCEDAVDNGDDGAGGPDSCRYANDGECDEGTYCPVGTDIADCSPAETEETEPTPEPVRDIPITGSNLVLLGFGEIDAQPQSTVNGEEREKLYFTVSEWRQDGDTAVLRLTADQPVERVWATVLGESTWYVMAVDPPSTTFAIRFRMVASANLQIASAFGPPAGAELVQYAFESSNGAYQGGRCTWCDNGSGACHCCEYKFRPRPSECELDDEVACGCSV